MEFSNDLSVVILAAGKGKRMISSLPKVMHSIIDKPMLYYVIREVQKLKPANIYVVTGFASETVEEYLSENFPQVKTIYQENQLGTGHAVSLLEKCSSDLTENMLVVTGDCPLIKSESLEEIVKNHNLRNNAATIMTAMLDNPFGYGRIIKNISGEVIKIVEEKDADNIEKIVKEINTSIYCFSTRLLFENLKNINRKNSQNEYYLTDVIGEFVNKKLKVSSIIVKDQEEILGVNDRLALSSVEKIMQKRINEILMISGVTIRNPEQTYIGDEAIIENDVFIEPQSFILGKTKIRKGCRIGPFTRIEDCEIEENCQIVFSFLQGSKISSKNYIGPFSKIKNQDLKHS